MAKQTPSTYTKGKARLGKRSCRIFERPFSYSYPRNSIFGNSYKASFDTFMNCESEGARVGTNVRAGDSAYLHACWLRLIYAGKKLTSVVIKIETEM